MKGWKGKGSYSFLHAVYGFQRRSIRQSRKRWKVSWIIHYRELSTTCSYFYQRHVVLLAAILQSLVVVVLVIPSLRSRTTPHEDNSPPDENKAQPLPTRTTIPRTIPHQDNSPLGPLPRNKTTLQDQNLYGGELSSWGVVRIRSSHLSRNPRRSLGH